MISQEEIDQLAEITEALIAMAKLDFSYPLSSRGNETLDAVSVGIMALSEELQASLIAKNLAEKANKNKESFIANLSHELRTPLTSIIACSEILAEGNLCPNQQRLIRQNLDSALLLQRLVNDILDFSQMESGLIELQPNLFEFEDLINRIVGQHKAQMLTRGIRLHASTLDFPKTFYLGDSDRIQQVLNNILINAMKFCHQGEIELRVHGLQQQKVVHFTIEICDTGIGIASENLDQIFMRFNQVDGSKTRPYQGMGIGLNIAKTLIEQMGGTISVQSELDMGSTFILRFKLPILAKAEHPSVIDTEAPLGKMLVLLVDDDETIRSVLREMLELLGCVVIEAGSGKEALQKIAGQGFDLIFMDYQMPNMDGLETTRKALIAHPDLRIVALTAHGTEADKVLGRRSGMIGYLSKPFTLKELRTVLDAHRTKDS